MVRMKMAAVSRITLLLFCCSVISSTDSADACEEYGATGGNFTVKLNHKLQPTQKLRWKHNTRVILDRKPPKDGETGHRFSQGAVKDILSDGSLKLENLNKTYEGQYTPEVFNADGTSVKKLKSVYLCVLDPVKKPVLQQKCAKSESVEFICNVDEPKDVTVQWLQNDNPTDGGKKSLKRQANKVEKDFFRCNVSNRVSSMISDAVKQECIKSSFPEEIMGISIWVFVGGGGGVVLVLIIIVIVCCVQAKRKKRMRLKDEEELRLGCFNPDQQQQQQHQHHRHQHHHPPDYHHHHQQQPAGHTGPRQHRPKQHREHQQRPRAPDLPNGHPQPSPRRPAQNPRPDVSNDEEQPPPLPQPRKKAPRTPKQ
ncbi:T-cell surface antigen CD2 [Lates calcarifer]|nr:T-cell surface antigen CD2 [Lates calcarifer]XP_018546112.1 T-cell surface antigen CD2 [Lates calcarifer]XP_018546113.1 T-cell surface antigen CD2 [Lates calcarifer]XP_018546114.1 T-cell surface antigen CD2 [Lates calcarifer]XP_018546115.1 T-cell surface antigen CD2 [Lates calcarifer]